VTTLEIDMSKPRTAGVVSRVMLGAFVVAGLYVTAAPRVFPGAAAWPDGVTGARAGAVRWLVGLLIGMTQVLDGYRGATNW
jgi:hypothetical protein